VTEGLKTGLFWAVAVVVLGIATIVAWPTANESETTPIIGKPLFAEFKDPLSAASMKIVTFDELQGTLASFEVRKDRQTGAWTIPSRKGYPADAVDQMKGAANALVDLKVLDIQTENAEDHDELGVVEPALEDLQIGDEGVGRLVTLKDESQNDLASIIIGDKVKDDPSKVYVRRPGQDPVYVVSLDEAPLTTRFQDWIEEDLLKLSSIEVDSMEIKDYSAILGQGGKIALNRNYTAEVVMDGAQWKLKQLSEFDPNNPMAEPTTVELGLDEELNSEKLNEIKDALDDLKIVDVLRKPEGMSENLRADKELTSDNDAVESLMRRGFYPVQTSENGDVEVLSANGELTVSLKDGVKYILRFGNVEGVTNEDDQADSEEQDEASSVGGVNRFLLVTTQVDQSKFPVPDLMEVPQTLEELEALLGEGEAKEEPEQAEAPEQVEQQEPAMEEPASEDDSSEEDSSAAESSEEVADQSMQSVEDVPAENVPGENTADEAAEEEAEDASDEEPTATPESGESELEGSGETTGQGQAQADSQEAEIEESEAGETQAEVANVEDESADSDAMESTDEEPEPDTATETASESESESEPELNAADASKPADEQLTEEEKLERLQSEQEKITKENQRKLDQRNDNLEAARRKVSELNARFADWYYVIPEDTYRKLRIRREELIQPAGSDEAAQPAMPPGMQGGGAMPQFNFGPPPSQ